MGIDQEAETSGGDGRRNAGGSGGLSRLDISGAFAVPRYGGTGIPGDVQNGTGGTCHPCRPGVRAAIRKDSGAGMHIHRTGYEGHSYYGGTPEHILYGKNVELRVRDIKAEVKEPDKNERIK